VPLLGLPVSVGFEAIDILGFGRPSRGDWIGVGPFRIDDRLELFSNRGNLGIVGMALQVLVVVAQRLIQLLARLVGLSQLLGDVVRNFLDGFLRRRLLGSFVVRGRSGVRSASLGS